MLRRIRSALKDAPPAEARVEPAAPSSAAETQQVVETFVRNAEAAQAVVSVVPGVADARRRVGEILLADRARSIVVSPDAASEPWSCAALPGLPDVRAVVRQTASSERGPADALAADAGITIAAFGLAETGTLVACASPGDHRLDSLLPPVNIALLPGSGLVSGLPDLFARLAADRAFDRHSAITLITGPSRTADIELTLTIGVHGPKKLFVILVTDQAPGAGQG